MSCLDLNSILEYISISALTCQASLYQYTQAADVVFKLSVEYDLLIGAAADKARIPSGHSFPSALLGINCSPKSAIKH